MGKPPTAEELYNPFTGFTTAPPSSNKPKPKPQAAAERPTGTRKRPREEEQAPTGSTPPPAPAAAMRRTNKLVSGQWIVFNTKKAAAGVPAGTKKVSSRRDATDDEVLSWRQEHGIRVLPKKGCPAPFLQLAQLPPLLAGVKAAMEAQGIHTPTPIQAQMWPILLQRLDAVGIAKTGSGKTLGFVVPAIAQILQDPSLSSVTATRETAPPCVILAPTRELAIQIESETRRVLPGILECTCLYGGTLRGPQLQAMQRSAIHILIATPGRLNDFLARRKVFLYRTSFLVLDEADRMLDMGFEPQVREICQQCPPNSERQTLMFSATWPPEVRAMGDAFMKEEKIRVHVGSIELRANCDIEQHFLFPPPNDEDKKIRMVYELLARLLKGSTSRVLVFCNMKQTVDWLEGKLRRLGMQHVLSIHGDKEQEHREYVMRKFRTEEAGCCLVATDVAARGLDIKQLDAVVNFDFPMTVEDYVHRIGRTGRAGQRGSAYTMLSGRERHLSADVLQQLRSILTEAKQEVPLQLGEWETYKRQRCLPSRLKIGRNARGPLVPYAHRDQPSGSARRRHAPATLFGVPSGR